MASSSFHSGAVHVDPAPLLADAELPLDPGEYFSDPFRQRVLEDVAVLALQSDFPVFDQKCIVHKLFSFFRK